MTLRSVMMSVALAGCCVSVIDGVCDDDTTLVTTPPDEIPTSTDLLDPSIRLMLFNVKFVADGDDVNDVVFADDAERAEHIAQRILAQLDTLDPDVIVFNEAFDEDAQDTLSSQLCAEFPFHSRFIDEADDDQHQDSGLMIFSRHPFTGPEILDPAFEALDHETFTTCVDADAGPGHPSYYDHIGFALYGNCANVLEDCASNKGAAMARFVHNGTDESFNVVFTHLQSDDDEAETRLHQMDDVEALIRSIQHFDEQRTFVVGDLNIDGMGCHGSGCDLDGHSGGEWQDHFGDDGDFFACTAPPCDAERMFIDSHGYEMPASDRGRTLHGAATVFADPSQGKRYDYVLHNVHEERFSCMQHFQVLRESILDDNGAPVSDHYPVLVDFNWRADHCNPLGAAGVPDSSGFGFAGRITYPGSVQWLRIDQPGTYTLISSNDTRLEVFTADDLSIPIRDDGGEPLPRGVRYRLPAPPYFVKVTGPTPIFTGAYALDVLRHDCGPDDSCGLTPADEAGVSAAWDGTAAVETASRWFHFDTDVADNGAFPEIEIRVTGTCDAPYEVLLTDSDDQVVPWASVAAASPTGITAVADALAPGRYEVEVHRVDDSDDPGCDVNVVFTTTLTYLTPGDMHCEDETGASGTLEEAGHDEIWIHLDVDGPCTAGAPLSAFAHLMDFDEDDNRLASLSALGVRKYIDCALLEVLEEDDIAEGDVTHLQTPLALDALDLLEPIHVTYRFYDDGDYRYRAGFTRTHEPDPPL